MWVGEGCPADIGRDLHAYLERGPLPCHKVHFLRSISYNSGERRSSPTIANTTVILTKSLSIFFFFPFVQFDRMCRRVLIVIAINRNYLESVRVWVPSLDFQRAADIIVDVQFREISKINKNAPDCNFWLLFLFRVNVHCAWLRFRSLTFVISSLVVSSGFLCIHSIWMNTLVMFSLSRSLPPSRFIYSSSFTLPPTAPSRPSFSISLSPSYFQIFANIHYKIAHIWINSGSFASVFQSGVSVCVCTCNMGFPCSCEMLCLCRAHTIAST